MPSTMVECFNGCFAVFFVLFVLFLLVFPLYPFYFFLVFHSLPFFIRYSLSHMFVCLYMCLCHVYCVYQGSQLRPWSKLRSDPTEDATSSSASDFLPEFGIFWKVRGSSDTSGVKNYNNFTHFNNDISSISTSNPGLSWV